MGAYQGLDNTPNDPILPQHTITRAAGTKGTDVIYPANHHEVGSVDATVRGDLISQAKNAGAPVN